MYGQGARVKSAKELLRVSAAMIISLCPQGKVQKIFGQQPSASEKRFLRANVTVRQLEWGAKGVRARGRVASLAVIHCVRVSAAQGVIHAGLTYRKTQPTKKNDSPN